MPATKNKQNIAGDLPLDPNDLTGIQKAAILLISLGVEKAAEILKKMKESEVEDITIAIAEMSNVEPDMVEHVREEFHYLIKSKEYMVEGGTEYARNLLSKSIGEEKADQIMKKHQFDQQMDAFSMFESAEMQQIVHFLENEQPQVAAVIIAHLKVEKAAEIITSLPEDTQADIAYRLASMGKISNEVIEELEDIIKDEMSNTQTNLDHILKGSASVASILNEMSLASERKVLGTIENVDAELAEEIRQQMFLFEDILELDDRSVQVIISKLSKQDMVMGLKGVTEKLKNKFINNMSERASEILLDDLDALGPVHMQQVEEAQQNIIQTIKSLEQEGTISLRASSDELID